MRSIRRVEDNESDRAMLARRLARRGYRVRLAVDGEEGVACARRLRPDLVPMASSLPVVDGWEAARPRKAGSETRRISTVALTAHAMISGQERARAAGCDDFDTRLIELSRLLDKMEIWPGRSSAQPAPMPSPA